MMAIPVFLINLDRSPDRLAFMQEQARRIGLAFERVRAVNGSAVPDFLREQFAASGDILADGEIGCYASHLVLSDRIVREGWPCALVLEDDVELMPELVEMAEAAARSAPQGWDYIHLSSVESKRALLGVARLPRGRHLVRYWHPPLNTGGYLISRQGAQKMLAARPRLRPIDQDIRVECLRGRFDLLGIYPPPVPWTDRLPTTIDSNWRGARTGTWNPKLSTRMRGHAYRLRRFGITGYISCLLANFARALERRLTGRKGVPEAERLRDLSRRGVG